MRYHLIAKYVIIGQVGHTPPSLLIVNVIIDMSGIHPHHLNAYVLNSTNATLTTQCNNTNNFIIVYIIVNIIITAHHRHIHHHRKLHHHNTSSHIHHHRKHHHHN